MPIDDIEYLIATDTDDGVKHAVHSAADGRKSTFWRACDQKDVEPRLVTTGYPEDVDCEACRGMRWD